MCNLDCVVQVETRESLSPGRLSCGKRYTVHRSGHRQRRQAHVHVRITHFYAMSRLTPSVRSLNPGRVEPMSSAWEETRKPVAAAWQTANGERFYTINVHMSSKRDSSSSHGNSRPPVNGHSERRTHQVEVVAVGLRTLHHALD